MHFEQETKLSLRWVGLDQIVLQNYRLDTRDGFQPFAELNECVDESVLRTIVTDIVLPLRMPTWRGLSILVLWAMRYPLEMPGRLGMLS